MFARLLILVAASIAVLAHADEEKFYSVVGPDGRIQLIRSGAEAPVASVKEESADKPDSSAAKTALPDSSEKTSIEDVATATATLPVAPYDSEQYADSEALDQALARPGDRQRFYVISDGMGTQLNQMDGTAIDDVSLQAEPPAEEGFESLLASPVTLRGDDALQAVPALSKCLSKTFVSEARVASFGRPVSALLNRQTYMFLEESRVVAAYRLEGFGLRSLLAESFSARDKAPAFASPRLAFFDGDGCITRIVDAFFNRLYAATPKRHPVLRADLLVHTGESYLLVLAPELEKQVAVSSDSYANTRYGQLQFTLRK